jgi:hypothetical protein
MSTKDSNGRSMPYNGWANYETWNVAQWLTATPDAYELSKRHRDSSNAYADMVHELTSKGITTTPDGVLLWCAELDLRALDDLIRELP